MEHEKKSKERDIASRRKPDERIFFIVKSSIMGCFGSVAFLLTILILGSINFWQAFFIGLLLFFVPFIIGRFFEKQINWLALKVAEALNKFPRMKKKVVKYI
jgi:uncharacterized membrane protein YjjP (DUF1212 family)